MGTETPKVERLTSDTADNMQTNSDQLELPAGDNDIGTEKPKAVVCKELLGITSNCLRCGTPCRLGTPDPKARAIVRASKAGFCPNCMIEHFFGSIEVLKLTISKLGPEIFLNAEWREKTLRPVMRGGLSHTQMPEDSINWIEVVGNWGMPWPKGHKLKEMQ